MKFKPCRENFISLCMLCLLGFFLIDSQLIFANSDESIIIAPNELDTEISDRLDIFADASRQLTIQDVTNQNFDGFKRNRVNAYSHGVFAGNLWIRFTLDTHGILPENLYLYIEKPLLEVRFFQETSHGLSEQKAGRAFATGDEALNSTFPVFRLEAPPLKQRRVYYVMIHNDGIYSLSLALRTSEEVWGRERLLAWVGGAVTGVLFIMILYNLFLFVSTREADFFWYSAAVFFLHYGVVGGGVTNSIFYSTKLMIFPEIWIPFCKIMGTIALVQFSRLFLRTKEQSNWVDKIFIGVNIYSVLMLPLFLVLPAAIVNAVDNLGAVVGLLVIIPYSGYLFSRGNKYARFYFIAWFPLLMAAGLHIFATQTKRGQLQHYTPTIFVLATLVEVLLISLALADKINVLREEKLQEEKASRTLKEDLDLKHREDILRINANLENLAQEKTTNIRALLDNLAMAVMSIEQDGSIGENVSAHTANILGQKPRKGDNILDVVFDGSNLGPDQKSRMMSAICAVIGSYPFGLAGNEEHLCKRFMKKKHNELRLLEADWSPVVGETGMIQALLLCIKDVTEDEKLKKAVAHAEKSGQIMTEILVAGPEKVGNVLSELRPNFVDFTLEIKRLMESHGVTVEQPIARISQIFFRVLHTQKAMTRQLKLMSLADEIHEFENIVSLLCSREPTDILLEKFIQASKRFEVSLHDYQSSLSTIMSSLKTGHAENSSYAPHSVGRIIQDVVAAIPDIARSAGKPVPALQILAPFGLELQNSAAQKLHGMLLHLIRNSIDHGLEKPNQRVAEGKTPDGLISLSLKHQPETHILALNLTDDGVGFNGELIFQKAQEEGIAGVERLPAQELIFVAGFSSKTSVTDLSGRGVGLDAVRADARMLGGDAKATLGRLKPNGNHEISFEVTLKAS